MKILRCLLSVQLLFDWPIYGHVTLTFPPARKLQLDFLNDAENDNPCGLSRHNESSTTTLIAGTEVNITWRLAYPHRGGIKLEVIEEDNFRVALSLLTSQFSFQNNYTRQHAIVTLPVRYTCDSCVIRLLRQAPEWGSNLVFISCADVTILPHPGYSYTNCKSGRNNWGGNNWGGDDSNAQTTEASTTQSTKSTSEETTIQVTVSADTTTQSAMSASQETSAQQTSAQQTSSPSQPAGATTAAASITECFPKKALPFTDCYDSKCLNGGLCNQTGACECPKLFYGERCEKFDECWSNADCNHGQCIDTRIKSHPRLLCYCEAGWYGVKCDKKSTVELLQDYTNNQNYKTRVIRPDGFTLHWRFVGDEIEMVVQARSSSWVGVGWRPLSLNNSCKTFFGESETRLNKPSSTSSEEDTNYDSIRNPTTDPELSLENSLMSNIETECLRVSGQGGGGQEGNISRDQSEAEPTAKKRRSLNYESDRNFTSMDCSDIVVGSIKGSLHRVQDMYTRDRSTPLPDHFYLGSDSITGAAGSQVDGVTTIVFRKRTEASDPSDHTIDGELMSVIWAVGLEVGSYRLIPPLDLDLCNTEDDLFYLHDALKFHGSKPSQRGAVAFRFVDDSPPDQTPTCATEDGEVRVPQSCDHANALFNCEMFLSWKLDVRNDVIEFVFKHPYSSTKWFAFGFSKSASMPDSDVIMSLIDAKGNPTLQDRWAEGYEKPAVDEDFNLFEEDVGVASGVVTMKFKRLRATEDPRDAVFSSLQCNFLMLASGPLDGNGDIIKHDPSPLLSDEQVCIRACDEATASFNGMLLLNGETYVPALLVPSSRTYRQLKQRMEDLLTQAYRSLRINYLLSVKVNVTGFKPGSIIVSYIVSAVFDPTLSRSLDTSVEVNLTAELDKYILENQLHLPGSSYFVSVIRGNDQKDKEIVSEIENKSAGTMLICLAFLFVAVALIELVKRSARKRHKHHILGEERRKTASDRNLPTQQYSDLSANQIYEKIYDVMKRRHTVTCVIDGRPRRVSNASELRRFEDAASRHHPTKLENEKRRGSEGQREKRPSFAVRPTSARAYPRRPSHMERRPQSAKRFNSKSSIDDLTCASKLTP